VKFLAGASSRTFTITSGPAESARSGSVSATLGCTNLAQDLTVTPMGLCSTTLATTSVAEMVVTPLDRGTLFFAVTGTTLGGTGALPP
jgi:hypothetical protein